MPSPSATPTLGTRCGAWLLHVACVLQCKRWRVCCRRLPPTACLDLLRPQVASGIEPGVHISIKSSNETIYTTLTFNAVSSLLTAFSGAPARQWERHSWDGSQRAGHSGGQALNYRCCGPLLLADWQQLHSRQGRYRQLLASADTSSMHVAVENRLGVDAAMELDFGDHL